MRSSKFILITLGALLVLLALVLVDEGTEHTWRQGGATYHEGVSCTVTMQETDTKIEMDARYNWCAITHARYMTEQKKR